jgi:large subunit ribosomal protein L15e
MSAYEHMKKTFIAEYKARSPLFKERVRKWRREGTIVRVEKPTNIARARTLGYRAKVGYVVVRVRIPKGMRKRPKPSGGRKPSKSGRFFSPEKSHRSYAEEKAARRFKNCEVLNSYWVGEDGQTTYFEIILIDRAMPGIDNNITTRKGRAFRGLTSAGKKSRGFRQ